MLDLQFDWVFLNQKHLIVVKQNGSSSLRREIESDSRLIYRISIGREKVAFAMAKYRALIIVERLGYSGCALFWLIILSYDDLALRPDLTNDSTYLNSSTTHQQRYIPCMYVLSNPSILSQTSAHKTWNMLTCLICHYIGRDTSAAKLSIEITEQSGPSAFLS